MFFHNTSLQLDRAALNSLRLCLHKGHPSQTVEDYDCRRSAGVLDGLFKEKMEAQPYRGAGVVLP